MLLRTQPTGDTILKGQLPVIREGRHPEAHVLNQGRDLQ